MALVAISHRERQATDPAISSKPNDMASVDTASITDASGTSVNTAGVNGAYYTLFCPPLPVALSNAYFPGYKCTSSKGTLENVARVLRYPTSIGFVQLDVYANEEIKHGDEFRKLTLIRSDIACEGRSGPDLRFPAKDRSRRPRPRT
jgi:hypothetical protein